MVGGGKDLSFRRADILPSARHHEHGFFPSHRRLYVGVRLRPQRFDLATWKPNKGFSTGSGSTLPAHQHNSVRLASKPHKPSNARKSHKRGNNNTHLLVSANSPENDARNGSVHSRAVTVRLRVRHCRHGGRNRRHFQWELSRIYSPCLPTISATCSELGTGTHSVIFALFRMWSLSKWPSPADVGVRSSPFSAELSSPNLDSSRAICSARLSSRPPLCEFISMSRFAGITEQV